MPSTHSAKWRFALLAVALLAATLLAYQPALGGKLLWDDEAHVTRPELRSLHGLVEIWTHRGATQQYYPLVHSVFWLEHRLWGDALVPYHLVNILLHVSSALLLFLILRQLGIPGAWLAAAIFALHPVQVESVAWISELKNTLSGFLFLSSALVYLKFDRSRHGLLYFAAIALFVLGLMSKSVIATLPAALVVVFWWKRGVIRWRRDVLPLLPFVMLGLGAGLVTVSVEKNQIGASGADFDFSFLDRCLIAGRAIWFYLGKLLCPIKLTFIYPRWQIDARLWWQYLFPLGVIALVVISYFIRKQWRGPLAALLLFIGVLFPALGFVNVFPFLYSFVADHFQYLASIAIITLVVAGFGQLFAKLHIPSQGSVVLGTSVICLLGVLTWRQAHAYTDAETLYRTTLERNPACWMAHNNLANILTRGPRTDEAIVHYREALRLRPAYAEAHYNLADALLRRGEVDEAMAHCEAALAIKPASPEAHNNLGNALRQKGQYADAIKHYEAALNAAPQSGGTKNNLAWVLATCPDESLRDFPKALRLAQEANEQSGGKNPIFLHTLSAAYAQSGQIVQARVTAQHALDLAQAAGNTSIADVLRKELAQLNRLLEEQERQ